MILFIDNKQQSITILMHTICSKILYNMKSSVDTESTKLQ